MKRESIWMSRRNSYNNFASNYKLEECPCKFKFFPKSMLAMTQTKKKSLAVCQTHIFIGFIMRVLSSQSKEPPVIINSSRAGRCSAGASCSHCGGSAVQQHIIQILSHLQHTRAIEGCLSQQTDGWTGWDKTHLNNISLSCRTGAPRLGGGNLKPWYQIGTHCTWVQLAIHTSWWPRVDL